MIESWYIFCALVLFSTGAALFLSYFLYDAKQDLKETRAILDNLNKERPMTPDDAARLMEMDYNICAIVTRDGNVYYRNETDRHLALNYEGGHVVDLHMPKYYEVIVDNPFSANQPTK